MLKTPSPWLSRTPFLGALVGVGLATAWQVIVPSAPAFFWGAGPWIVLAGYLAGVGIASRRRRRADVRYILRLRGELRLAQDYLMDHASFRSLGSYLDTTAATLQGPLRDLVGRAGTVSEDPSQPESAREAVDGIRRQAEAVQEILGPLASYSITRPSRAPFSLNDLLRDSIDLCRHRAEEKKIRFDERYAVLPPVFGPADRTQQALLNVIINAVEAMQFRGGTITVETSVEGDLVIGRIRDTGLGIRPEHLPRVFDPFFTTKPERTQAGLGLWVARETLAMIGGSIVVQSTPHQGTEVVVTLPQAAPIRAGRLGDAASDDFNRNTADEGDRRIA